MKIGDIKLARSLLPPNSEFIPSTVFMYSCEYVFFSGMNMTIIISSQMLKNLSMNFSLSNQNGSFWIRLSVFVSLRNCLLFAHYFSVTGFISRITIPKLSCIPILPVSIILVYSKIGKNHGSRSDIMYLQIFILAKKKIEIRALLLAKVLFLIQ